MPTAHEAFDPAALENEAEGKKKKVICRARIASQKFFFSRISFNPFENELKNKEISL